MKFKILREALLRPLQIVCTVADARPKLPILSHVLFRLENGTEMTLIGTDLEVEQRLMIREGVTVLDASGLQAFTVPAKKLLDLCRALPESSELELTVDTNEVQVKSNKSKFKLLTLSANEFPSLTAFTVTATGSVSSKKLLAGMSATAFSMADNDVRYYLNGMLLEFQTNELTMVSTDGHRLSIHQVALDTPVDIGKEVSVIQSIVPKKSILNIMKFLDEKGAEFPVTFGLSANHLQLSFNNQVMSIQLIDGRFPDYRRVIPKNLPREVQVDRLAFLGAVQRVTILSNSKYRGGIFNFLQNSIECAASNEEHETAVESVDAEFVRGEPLEIGFNLGYVMDTLGAMKSDTVVFCLSVDANGSATVASTDPADGALYVLMPMRL